MKACVLIKTEPGTHIAIAKIVAQIKGVKTAFAVLGRTDVVANVDADELADVSRLVFLIGDLDGVTETETLIGMTGVL
jgi:uncharacterized protein with GYD domain